MRPALGAANPADPFTRLSSFKWLASRKLAAAIASAAPEARGRLLDVGCGGRRFAHYFRGRVTRYIGLDYPTTFDAERRHVDVFGDGLRLPFQDDSFDTVVCFEVLEHVKDGALLARELARVVRPGGAVILTVPFLWGEHCQPHDYARYTVFGVREIFSRAGLGVARQQRVGGFWTVAGQRLCYHLEPAYARLGRWMHTSLSGMVLACAALLEQLDPGDGEYTMSLVVARKPHTESSSAQPVPAAAQAPAAALASRCEAPR